MNNSISNNKYSIGLGITSLCNMNCEFCYSVKKRKNCINLPIQAWYDFFKINNEYISNINFGTGENTLVDDWFLLIQEIKDLAPNIGQALTTNGSLITEIKHNKLKMQIVENCIRDIDISLDYADKKKHNSFRGNNNAYQMAIATLEYCKDGPFNTTIVIMGIEDNLSIDNLSGIFELAFEFNAIVRLNIYREVNANVAVKPPSLQSIVRALDWIYNNHIIYSLSDPLFSAIFSKNQKKEDPSGISSIRILPDGGVYPSTYLISKDFWLGHIYDENLFQNIRKSEIIHRLKNTVPEDCKKCRLQKNCKGGAIDRRILSRKDITKRDPYCPILNGFEPKLRNYKVAEDSISLIHDGYLPTLIFKPK